MSDIIDASRPLGSFSEDASSCRDVSTIPAAYQGLAVYHLEDDEGFCLPLDQDGRIVFSSQGTARAVSEGFLNTNRDGCIDVSRIDLETPANGPFWHQGPSCYSLDNVDNTITYYNHYGHDPSLPAGIIFTALFGLAMLAHVLLTLMSRRKWLIVTAVGGLTELIGWIGRTLSATDNTASAASDNYFLIQTVCLIIGPVFFSAACYGLFCVMVQQVAPEASRLSNKALITIFVVCDFISLVLQAAGGGMSSGAETQDELDQGTNIMVAGIVFQLASMALFCLYALDYVRRVRNLPNRPRIDVKTQICAWGVVFASVMILIRGGYRSPELVQGWRGELITKEGYFLGLDAVVMALCIISLAVTHPAITLPSPQKAMIKQRDGLDSDSLEKQHDPSMTTTELTR